MAQQERSAALVCGNGKTLAALIVMECTALLRKLQTSRYPCRVFGATGSHRSHELKTCRTFESPSWGGLWKLYDSNRAVVFRQRSTDFIHLDLFGVEIREAIRRFSKEPC